MHSMSLYASAWSPRGSVRVSAQGTQHRLVHLAKAPPIRAPLTPEQRVADFRFWHDEKRFRGSGDESLAQHTLLAAGGVRMGGNPKSAPSQGPMGWQVVDSWDILWSTSDGAHKAAPLIKPHKGQLINALPGLESLTRKRNLALTLHAAYGEDAWGFVPRTYSLPSQLLAWRQRLAVEAAYLSTAARTAAAAPAAEPASTTGIEADTAANKAADVAASTAADPAAVDPSHSIGQVTGWWALKTGQHLGQGLQVVPSSQALSMLLQRNAPHMQAAAAQQQQQQQQQEEPLQQREPLQQQQSQLQQQQQDIQPLVPPQLLQQQSQRQQQSAEGVSSGATNSTDSSHGSSSGSEVAESSQGSSSSSSSQTVASSSDLRNPPRPFLSVQQYITQPLLINNRKFGIRVWVLVIGPKLYRAFIYQQGLVLFSSQQYNPELSAVQAEGPESEGHLTNAALWGGEALHSRNSSSSSSESGQSSAAGQHNRGSSGNSGSSSSSSQGPVDPAQQPVWSLQQLCEVLGQQQADAVTAHIHETAGRVVAAAAAPVAEAAQQLQWDGDAAFELLGLDFLLDSSLKPWLLEVNASPSMAWNVAQQPGASQLMYSIKQEMLTDMFALLRLQDRYPVAASTAAAAVTAAAAGPTGTAAAAAAGAVAEGAARQSSSVATAQPAAAAARQAGAAAAAGALNPVLLQAASEAYFGSRPHIARLVAQDACDMAAAVAAAPQRQEVEQAVLQVLLQQQQAVPGGRLSDAAAGERAEQQQGMDYWQQHLQQVVHVECELQSCGGWKSLLPQMLKREEAYSKGWQLHSSAADAAAAHWLEVRPS